MMRAKPGTYETQLLNSDFFLAEQVFFYYTIIYFSLSGVSLSPRDILIIHS